jgi:Uncharacterized protein conserved in bacteria
MKLIFAVVNREDSNLVSSELTKAGYSVTKLATTGGFLLSGNITLIIGTQEEKVEKAIQIIEKYSQKRTEVVPSTEAYGTGVTTTYPVEVPVGGATIFVVDVERFEKV